MTSEYRKEIAQATYKALLQRKKQKIRDARTKDGEANITQIECFERCSRHRWRVGQR